MMKKALISAVILALVLVGCSVEWKTNPKTTGLSINGEYSSEKELDFTAEEDFVRMTVVSASPKAVETKVVNETKYNVRFSNGYKLHFEQDGKWYELPVLDEQNADMAIFTPFVNVPGGFEETDFTFKNAVDESYGKLPDGKYRIIRIFRFEDENGEPISEEFLLAAEFIIE